MGLVTACGSLRERFEPLFRKLIRFGIAGLFNTIVGYALIVALVLAGVGDFIANAAVYSVGLVLSFTLNRRYVFSPGGAISRLEVVKFLIAFAVSYGANIGVLSIARAALGEGNPLAQLPAMATYSLVQFTLCHRFVFPQRS